jgi:hypothetical protein
MFSFIASQEVLRLLHHELRGSQEDVLDSLEDDFDIFSSEIISLDPKEILCTLLVS